MAAKVEVSDAGDLIARYLAGASLLQLSHETPYSRMVLGRLFKERNIPLRGRSEAERLKWSRLKADRAAVERQCAAAWRAVRGRPVPLETKLKCARTMMARLHRIAPSEERLARWLRTRGFKVAQQVAIGPYNVDLVLCPVRIAVEIQCANHRRPWASTARQRLEYLIDRDWRVVIVWVPLHRCLTDPEPPGKQLIALAEQLRREPAMPGQYGVIGRNGQPVTPRRYDLPRRPRIPGL